MCALPPSPLSPLTISSLLVSSIGTAFSLSSMAVNSLTPCSVCLIIAHLIDCLKGHSKAHFEKPFLFRSATRRSNWTSASLDPKSFPFSFIGLSIASSVALAVL
ncbi:hypothetical protein BLNAU_13400 [Blattamonas nauphoetae]|uniref:Uncharacterized protein n=1 Tax=Blattamonas nauphoetae TaxID=2049346 RepID=A0ABQ9XI11_9EUKA|nr:hypothetical protein BLNAU_13400 [Blattamonas nauphoetae]